MDDKLFDWPERGERFIYTKQEHKEISSEMDTNEFKAAFNKGKLKLYEWPEVILENYHPSRGEYALFQLLLTTKSLYEKEIQKYVDQKSLKYLAFLRRKAIVKLEPMWGPRIKVIKDSIEKRKNDED